MSTIERARSRSRIAAIAVAMLVVLVTLVTPLSSAPAASAAPGPEPVSGTYVHWAVVDTTGASLAGATFQVQRDSRSFFGGSWQNSWTTVSTVTDCATATSCSGADIDPDAGEFQVVLPTSGGGFLPPSYRYRVVAQTTNGLSWTTTTTSTMPASTWNGDAYDFGQFVSAPRPRFACTAGTFYAQEANGAVQQITVTNGAGTVSSFLASQALSFGNALGVAANGDAYMVERSSGNAGVDSVLRYSTDAGWTQVFGAVADASGTAAVAGAVSVDDGRYYFGGPLTSNAGFRLFSYDHANRQVRLLGTLSTGLYVNGDMGFDATGNLVIVQGASVFTVSRAALDAANGGSIAYSTATGASFTSDVNGIAFDADGSVYASVGTSVRRHVQTGGTWALASTATVATIPSSSDLASCHSPVTISVLKDVPKRVADTDQFTLQLRQGSGGAVVASATTSGTQPNVQPQRISSFRSPTSAVYTITESMASGSGANYASSWACTSNGAPYASGAGTSISLTTPSVAGAEVVCTFTNRTLLSSIAIRKDVQDVDGGNVAPRAGWTVGAAVTAGATQVGAVTASNQQTAGNGTATWTVRHSGATASASIAISESQQPGFEFVSGYCDVTPLGGSATRTLLTSAAGATLSIAPGSTVACVFTNKVKPTTLTLVKQVTSGTAPTSLFALAATAATGAPSGTLAGPTGASGTNATTSARITPGVAYRLSESGGPATYVQVGSWTCVDQSGAAVAVTAAGDMTAAQGSEVTCTVRNGTASLVLLQTVEGSSALQPNQFTLRATPTAFTGGTLTATTRTGSAQVAGTTPIEVRPGHGYALESTSTAAHIGLRLECYTGPGSTTCFSGTTAPTAAQLADQANWRSQTSTTAVVAANGTAYYRFVATSPTPFTLPITGGIGADQIQLLGAGLAASALLTGLGILLHRRRRAA
ncbi:hypothetical protein LG314_01305 [Agrococcus terreus]|uniref:hypothetical protein n=1 Tax=Agrococcus terreus TaxID=574649 RepID=UPI00384BA5A3